MTPDAAGQEKREVVIVGASLAGLRSAHTLRDEGYDGPLTIIGDEHHPPYDRPPLSKELLAGRSEPADLSLPVHEDLRARWLLGRRAVALDTARRVVRLADGTEVPYAGLVLATGSGTRTLPAFDHAAPTVHVLRTMADALALRDALGPATRLLIVGSGFVGVEVASSARSLGAEVTMASLDEPLAVAGHLVSEAARRLLTDGGVRLVTGHTVTSVDAAAGAAHRIGLSDGSAVDADHVVVAIGSVPNTGWLDGSGASLGDGVVCDERLRVLSTDGAMDDRPLDGVVAAGDIVNWPNPAFGGMPMRVEHWSNAVEQGAAAARTLLHGAEAKPFTGVPSFWSDHFGIRLQSVGLPTLADRFEVIDGTVADGRFAAEAYAGDHLVGGVAYGRPKAMVTLRIKLARTGVPPVLTRSKP
ncbi:NAD(P)/FAD-dependent oxidoreductase [Streptomyces sp. 6N223]|uniref:NAD(P)/FAD-dependent oxidoreductase n=1 Tax=Streptomyces sp. 6N223 TaxID=3457412 RepID=UPI003FD65731